MIHDFYTTISVFKDMAHGQARELTCHLPKDTH